MNQLPSIQSCPKCRGELQEQENSLICRRCRMRYSLNQGIPIMIVDSAEKAS
ncbi:MAG: Trm112 family protein [Candidatus Altiarchaeia archaeon]